MDARSNIDVVARELGAVEGSRRPDIIAKLLGYTLRGINASKKHAARRMLARLVEPRGKTLRFEAVGDGEGSWSIPVRLLRPGWIAYCVGVGANASFDEKLASDYGMKVYSIDPTPLAVTYMASRTLVDQHAFLPVGVWNSDTVLRLYAPMSASANLSTRDIHGTGRYVELPCKTLTTIMNDLGHERIDLLKIDIEGSWYEVIEDLCRRKIRLSILCAEFDSPTSPWKAKGAIDMLKTVDLHLVRAERENLIFVSGDLLRSA